MKTIAATLMTLAACTTTDIATDAEVRERVPCLWMDSWNKNHDNIRMGCEAPCQSELTLGARNETDRCVLEDDSPFVCHYGEWRGRRGCCNQTDMGAIFVECE